MKPKLLIIIIVLALLIFFITKKTEKPTLNLLEETSDFNYNSQNIQEAILQIKGKTDMEKLRNVLNFISENIRYDYDVPIDYCYQETASMVLEKRSGDCVSKARLAVSMLRGLNIPTRTVGGCVKESYTCSSLMAFIKPIYEQPKRPKTLDRKKRGYLHEWLEVIINGKTYLADPTSGAIFSAECADYKIYSYDTNQYDRCVINDQKFIEGCYNWY